MCHFQGRSQAWAWGDLCPPKKNIAPPKQNETRLGLYFLLDLSQEMIETSFKKRNLLLNCFAQTSAKISPLKPKILATSLD